VGRGMGMRRLCMRVVGVIWMRMKICCDHDSGIN
jgi:hypothetical protein